MNCRLIACLATLAVASAATASGQTADLGPRPVGLIKPGAAIDQGPPLGWSHLIVKNQPYLDETEAAKVVAVAADLAGSLFAAIVANVARDPTMPGAPYRLEAVAAGIGTKIKGQDVVVSSETQADLGADLGLVARTVLSRSEDELKAWRQVALTPTIALIDAPTMVHFEGEHLRLITRYAILVDRRDGRLTTFAWMLAPAGDGAFQLFQQPLMRLNNNLVHRYPLIVDEDEVTVGVPSNGAFAMGRLPKGERATWSDAARALAVLERFGAQQLATLERELWRQAGPSPAR